MTTQLNIPDTIEVRSPATGEVFGTVPVRTAAELETVVRDLRAAPPAWQALGPAGRARWLRALRDWLLDNKADVAAPSWPATRAAASPPGAADHATPGDGIRSGW